MKVVYQKYKLIFWVALGCMLIAMFTLWRFNKHANQFYIVYDVGAYYTYLPATFIYHDLKELKFVDGMWDYWKTHKKASYKEVGEGHRVVKTTMGMAILYSPAFFVANVVADLKGIDHDGYSRVHDLILALYSTLFLFVGLLLTGINLMPFFGQRISAAVIALLGLGTNLFNYSTVDAPMSHVYSFALFSLFIWLSVRWLDKASWGKTAALGALTGLIVLIRPVNLLIVLFLVLFGVTSRPSLRERVRMFLSRWHHLLVMITMFFLVWVPQLLYWRMATGHWLVYSYGEAERFFWTDPKILYGLFSWRKGWLIYTPLMWLLLPGILLLWKRARPVFWPVLVVLLLSVYVTFSWWSWWYGGGFSCRPLIEYYAVFAFAIGAVLGYLFQEGESHRIRNGAITVLLLAVTALNVFQTYQFRYHIIHWDSMTCPAYKAVFMKKSKPEGLDALLLTPSNELRSQGYDEYRWDRGYQEESDPK